LQWKGLGCGSYTCLIQIFRLAVRESPALKDRPFLWAGLGDYRTCPAKQIQEYGLCAAHLTIIFDDVFVKIPFNFRAGVGMETPLEYLGVWP
jgi:hypothetical protein